MFDPKATGLFDVPPLGAGFRLEHPEGSDSRPVALSTGFLTESAVMGTMENMPTATGDSGGSMTPTATSAASASTSTGAAKTSGGNGVMRGSVKKLGAALLGVLLFGVFA